MHVIKMILMMFHNIKHYYKWIEKTQCYSLINKTFVIVSKSLFV